ncbi:single-stranded-DNA-specific exonuclease RecJ [Chloroflexota bacterium]
MAQLLYNRGITTPVELQLFISADKRLCGDPWLMPDMHQAVVRIYRALLSGENIAVYGDYDADGITGTALLVHGLSLVGGKAIPYIPHRQTEGHGIRSAVLKKLQQEGVSLVISVDCGITALKEVKQASRNGLDVVITDHHTPLDEVLPPAIAVIDPKRTDASYPFTELAGVGVGLKLLQALFQSVGKETLADGLLDMVALGTVADMSPLTGENRYLVKQGLQLINTAPRLGIGEIITLAGLTPGSIDSESVSWVIAPWLNATGRMTHAMESYQLLTTESREEAHGLATSLEQTNQERQRLTEKMLVMAREKILEQEISPLLIADDREFAAGISGLVAGRLREEFYRPAVIVKIGEQTSNGSCRSIPEFNIIQALTQCRDLFTHFGGHSQAAGFTMPTCNLPALYEHLSRQAATQLDGVDLRPRLDIEAEVTLPELSGNTLATIQKLAPFGRGNPVPTFISRSVEVIDCRTMGNNGNHLRLKLKQGGTVWSGVAFRLGDCLTEVSPLLDIVYNLEIDRWRGEERLRLNIRDFAPSS